ncbi:unnamed protein product [Ectocarpus sp. 8 AP-2014]
MGSPNKIASMVGKIKGNLPASLQPWALSLMFNSQVKLAGTAGVRVEELTPHRSVVKVANVRRVQNHIGSVHACGMALAAESATGILVGMSVPDSRLPLCKSMAIDFTRLSQGDVTAVAELSEEQLTAVRDQEKGEANVQVTVTDESGKEPIRAEFVWAWVPKRRKK